jgi:pyruvate/2-oxoglutarate dehydrogenase complex dihydrolipoamide dehydrogenase (E3) component
VRTLTPDLAIIGAGSAGLSAAAGAAQLGLDVVLYEKAEMGGDCLNHGCVPSKALLSAAKAAHDASASEKYGVSVSGVSVDWQKVKAHVRGAIETIAPVDSQERFEGFGCTVIRETARFEDRNTLVSATSRVKPKRIIVATGSTAFIPPIEGLDKAPYLTNETVFSIPDLPKHLIILGGGPIGMELGQAFNRLGAKVTVIEMGAALGRSDPAHAAITIDAVKSEGVSVLEGHKAVRVSGAGTRISVHTETGDDSHVVEGSHVLVAVGRRPVLDGLELDAGGVAFDRRGISVGDNLRSTSNPRVWALGDAAGQGQFTHIAGWHASVFVRRALFKQRTKANSLPFPAVTYTSPEIAQIGLTEAEAHEKFGDKIKTSSFPFHENDRAIAEGKTLGECKLVIKGNKLVGASIVGDGAGDILQLVSVAMSNNMKLTALTNFISPYPTRAEVVKRAASAHYTPALFAKRTQTLVGLLQRIP